MSNNPKSFLEIMRQDSGYRPVCERVRDFREVVIPRSGEVSAMQATRCMDCGTPFCHWGCPLGNFIPEWNRLLARGKLEEAVGLLQATNVLPEITGRLCPAICEYSCVLGINDDQVTIRENEYAVVEQAFGAGLIVPSPPLSRTGRRVAVVGSGPAGLACAARLNRAGHSVTVFERDDMPGGIMRYGIPDFKLEKDIIDRRIDIWRREGIKFRTGINVGVDISAAELIKRYDAVCLAGGSRVPRDLDIDGRELGGIHFAMDYLIQSNRRSAGEEILPEDIIDARGRKVVVVGGGDTGADCVGTAHRQGAACVVQIEVLPQPPESRPADQPWPGYPMLLKTSTSHEEGGERQWAVLTKRFNGGAGGVKSLSCIRVEFPIDEEKSRPVMREIPGSDFEIEADLVILAIGFLHPEWAGMLDELGVELDPRGNVRTNGNYMTSLDGIFSAGDMRRGQSLIAWAVAEGMEAARCIDEYLETRGT